MHACKGFTCRSPEEGTQNDQKRNEALDVYELVRGMGALYSVSVTKPANTPQPFKLA